MPELNTIDYSHFGVITNHVEKTGDVFKMRTRQSIWYLSLYNSDRESRFYSNTSTLSEGLKALSNHISAL